MPRLLFRFACVAVVAVVSRCAQISPLSGGVKDTTPPKLIKTNPPQKHLNSNTREIILEFDEGVQLRDLSNQLVVTPSLREPPEIVAEGRRVRIVFDRGRLLPNTTYRISLGKAVADIHESNPMPSLEYVFSTGGELDTLAIEGRVEDARDGSPAREATVGLYLTDPRDSIYFRAPDYYTRSTESGSFHIPYLPRGSFFLCAFTDKNRNGTYDGEAEKVAFVSQKVAAGSDSLVLRLFQEEPKKLFLKKTNSNIAGFAEVIMNRRGSVKLEALKAADAGKMIISQVGMDTMKVHYRDIKDTVSLLITNEESGLRDTLLLPVPVRKAKMKHSRSYEMVLQSGFLPFRKDPQLRFEEWMDTAYHPLKRVRLVKEGDSVEVPLTLKWEGITTLVLQCKLAEGERYTLKTDTGAFRNIAGLPGDSQVVSFKTHSLSDFGKVKLMLRSQPEQSRVILQLVDAAGVVVAERIIDGGKAPGTVEFAEILPGTYKLRVVVDENGNGRWDAGDISLRRQPEVMKFLSKQVKVMGDWESEEEISLNELK